MIVRYHIPCNIKFWRDPVDVCVTTYPNARWAVLLRAADTGEPVAKCTVNIPGEYIQPQQVFVKNYGGNEGMIAWMIEAKLIESEPVRWFAIGDLGLYNLHPPFLADIGRVQHEERMGK